jgi:hypothetical protein
VASVGQAKDDSAVQHRALCRSTSTQATVSCCYFPIYVKVSQIVFSQKLGDEKRKTHSHFRYACYMSYQVRHFIAARLEHITHISHFISQDSAVSHISTKVKVTPLHTRQNGSDNFAVHKREKKHAGKEMCQAACNKEWSSVSP